MKSVRSCDGSRVPGGPADLLLRCLSARAEPALSEIVRLTSAEDWHDVADIAIRHDVAPLLFRRLKKGDARTHVPAAVWERLRLNYLVGAARNARLHRWLTPVLDGLRGAGIPVIVLKGAFLADAVYGDVALRPMCDVDLMVSMAEMPKARAALLDMGGVAMERTHLQAPPPDVQVWDIESVCRKKPHVPGVIFRHLIVEIHMTLVPPTETVRVDALGLWQRARPATIAGVEVLGLSPEDLLLHLCLHVCCQHRLDAGLLCFCDIAEAIHRYRDRMDWDQLVGTAREWGATRYAALTFRLVGRMLGAVVPDGTFDRLVPGGLDQRILETASESVLARLSGPICVSRSVRDLWGTKSLVDRARLVWKRVFLSREEMAEEYPESRNARHLCSYYARRFRDVLNTHGASVRRMMLNHGMRQRARKMAAVTDWLESREQ